MASSTISPTTPICVNLDYLGQIGLQVRCNRRDLSDVGQLGHFAHDLSRVTHCLGQLDVAEDIVDTILHILDLSLRYESRYLVFH